jgi:hypothetical protein
MSIRKWFHGKASVVAGLGIPADRVFAAGAVGAAIPGDSPTRPFAVIRYGPRNPGVQPNFPVKQQVASVWVHDEPGTMKNIDAAVEALEVGLKNVAPVAFEGMKVMECRWIGNSEDFYDDHFQTNVVNVEFQLTWKPAP